MPSLSHDFILSPSNSSGVYTSAVVLLITAKFGTIKRYVTLNPTDYYNFEILKSKNTETGGRLLKP